MDESVNDRPVAVITGAATGIGAATARRLAAGGFHVIVHTGRNIDGANQIAGDLGKVAGCQATARICDFRQPDSLAGFVDDCFTWRGRVDVWVNNAGADVLTGAAVERSFVDKLDELWRVDVAGTLVLARDAGRRMQRQSFGPGPPGDGLIVNIGWDQADQGMAGDSGQLFSATKGAVMAATRSLARSLAPNVRVNCVAPGWIRTAWGQSASANWQERARHESLLDRWGQPSDVAGVIAFLASPDGQWVNGQVIHVNGGFRFGADRHEETQS